MSLHYKNSPKLETTEDIQSFALEVLSLQIHEHEKKVSGILIIACAIRDRPELAEGFTPYALEFKEQGFCDLLEAMDVCARKYIDTQASSLLQPIRDTLFEDGHKPEVQILEL